MFEIIHPSGDSIVPGLEEYEVMIGKNQPEYSPLKALMARNNFGTVLTRWTLTPEQRKAIADGADIYIENHTFNRGFNPVRVAIGENVDPDFIREQYSLP